MNFLFQLLFRLCLHYNSQIFTLIHQRLLIFLINVRILLTSFLQNISSSSGSRFKDDNDEEEYKENSLLNHFFFIYFFLFVIFYNSMSFFFLNEKQQHCKRITDRRTDAHSYSFYRICYVCFIITCEPIELEGPGRSGLVKFQISYKTWPAGTF